MLRLLPYNVQVIANRPEYKYNGLLPAIDPEYLYK